MSNVRKLNEYSDDVSNAELVKKSQLGDKGAFEELVKRHQELVFSLAYKLTGNRELANDVAQEAFIRAWKAIQKFRGDSTFSTWIYRITVNTAWTLRKKAKKTLLVCSFCKRSFFSFLKDLLSTIRIPKVC